MKKYMRFACVILLTFAGCAPTFNEGLQSPLEIREAQTREFATSDNRLVMKAVLNVLQDEGFITKNAVSDLGLLTATKETDASNTTNMIVSSIFMGAEARWPKTRVVEANANVSEFGKQTRVRISFVEKILDNAGATMEVHAVHDLKTYQDFFTKVDQSVFIQHEKI